MWNNKLILPQGFGYQTITKPHCFPLQITQRHIKWYQMIPPDINFCDLTICTVSWKQTMWHIYNYYKFYTVYLLNTCLYKMFYCGIDLEIIVWFGSQNLGAEFIYLLNLIILMIKIFFVYWSPVGIRKSYIIRFLRLCVSVCATDYLTKW